MFGYKQQKYAFDHVFGNYQGILLVDVLFEIQLPFFFFFEKSTCQMQVQETIQLIFYTLKCSLNFFQMPHFSKESPL